MPFVLLFLAFMVLVVLGSHFFARTAPPLSRAVELVEKDARVTALVGSPAKVSLTTTTRLKRNPLNALRGQDVVSVLSTVEGPKGEATFRLEARNIDGQGWAGTFAVESSGRSVLVDGKYANEGSGVVIEGDFAPDGAARPKKQ